MKWGVFLIRKTNSALVFTEAVFLFLRGKTPTVFEAGA